MAFIVRILFAPGSTPAYVNNHNDTTYRAKNAARFATREEAEKAQARAASLYRFGIPFVESVPDADAGDGGQPADP